MSHPSLDIEHEMFMLFRAVAALEIQTSAGELDRSSYAILRLLDDEGPVRLGQIAATYRLDPSTITRQVQTVVRQGLAERRTDPGDRRATILSLTQAGETTVSAVRTQRSDLFERAVADWPEGERDSFVASLRQLTTALRAELDSEAAKPV